MKNEKHKIVKLKANGQQIEVYRLANGRWCDYSNCTDTYHETEFEVIKEKERE